MEGAPGKAGLPQLIFLKGGNMKRQNVRSTSKKSRTKKARSRTRARKTTTWADPISPVSKMSKRKRTQTGKKVWKKDSCWWFC